MSALRWTKKLRDYAMTNPDLDVIRPGDVIC